MESTRVGVPTAIGWLRPVILLPASALSGLTPQQLELILAHELAHIRRHDYLVNLFQVAVETLLFYHPAAWWVSRQVRIEREHACDDLAVAVCGDAIAYARVLARMERLRGDDAPPLAVAANGGELSGRVRRLVENPEIGRRYSSPLAALLLAAAFIALLACSHSALSHIKQSSLSNERQSFRRESAPTNGRQNVEVAKDRPVLSEETAASIAGDETAGEDAEVRRVAVAALGNRAGTVVVMNPRTGQVYAAVNQDWAVRRSWRPASIMKLVLGAAGVEGGIIEPSQRLRLSARVKALDLTEALAFSDNAYFSFVAKGVGAERLIAYAREMGLGEQTGINYAGESAGRLPLSAAGADASRIGAYGDSVEVTPVQLATMVSAIANGGTLLVPRADKDGAQFEPQVRRRLRVPQEILERLGQGMIAAVSYGTGKGASNHAQTVAGKTATFVGDKTRVGIFASYAPADDPQLVVVVLTRGRDESGPQAAAVAGTIYRALQGRR